MQSFDPASFCHCKQNRKFCSDLFIYLAPFSAWGNARYSSVQDFIAIPGCEHGRIDSSEPVYTYMLFDALHGNSLYSGNYTDILHKQDKLWKQTSMIFVVSLCVKNCTSATHVL